MKLKKGDKVIVTTGKDKGKSGVIDAVIPTTNRVLISGVNVRKVHQRARRTGEKGSTIEKNFPIHASNVMAVDGSGKPTRLGSKMIDGKKVRVARTTGNAL